MRRLVSTLTLLGLIGVAIGLGQDQSRDLVMAPGPMPVPIPTARYGHSYALIIGINHYLNLPHNQLHFAVADAKDVAQELTTTYSFDTSLDPPLYDDDATLANIKKALAKLADPNLIKPNDRVLIYYSGHGQSIKYASGDMAFLIPADAPAKILDAPDLREYEDSCLSEPQFESYLDQIPAKHVAVIADACFSGRLALGHPDSPQITQSDASSLIQLRTHEVLAACGSGQEAQEWDGHGAFTRELLDSLNQHAQSGQPFSVMNLWCDIQPKVIADVYDHTKGEKNQVPQFNPLDSEGQFILYSKPLAGAIVAGGSDPGGKPHPSELKQDASPFGFTAVNSCVCSGAVAKIQFSPDDSQLAVTGREGSVTLFDRASGSVLRKESDSNSLYRISSDFKRIFGLHIVQDHGKSGFRMTALNLDSGRTSESVPYALPAGATITDFCIGGNWIALCGSSTGSQHGFTVVFELGNRAGQLPEVGYANPVLYAAITADGSEAAFLEEPADLGGTAVVHCYKTTDTLKGKGEDIPLDFKTDAGQQSFNSGSDLILALDRNKGALLALTLSERRTDGSVATAGSAVIVIPAIGKSGQTTEWHARGFKAMHVTGLAAGGEQVFGWRPVPGGTVIRRAETTPNGKDEEAGGSPMWPDQSGNYAAQADPDGKVTIFQNAG